MIIPITLLSAQKGNDQTAISLQSFREHFMWLQSKERPGNIIFNTFLTINGQTPDIKEKDGEAKSPLPASPAPPFRLFCLYI